MSDSPSGNEKRQDNPVSVHELLLELDLATEVLEGLDELGVQTRDELILLLANLEKQIDDAT